MRDDPASSDVAAIERIHDSWIQYERDNTPARVLELCSERLRWIPPEGPEISGKNAIRDWLLQNPAAIVQLQTSNREIWITGMLASLRARFETRIGEPGGKSRTFRGRHQWVLEEEHDGQWRVVVVSWSVDAEDEV